MFTLFLYEFINMNILRLNLKRHEYIEFFLKKSVII